MALDRLKIPTISKSQWRSVFQIAYYKSDEHTVGQATTPTGAKYRQSRNIPFL